MLVIRRRPGESVLIGGDVEVEVIDIGPTRVKLGITAPKEIVVLRKEVRLTREENLAAARGLAPEKLVELAARFRR
jgi:carbon storage regulator